MLGNINTIESAFKSVLEKKGYSYVTKFNFSTETAFKKSLEKNNFIIDELVLYDRPTILMDGEKGLCNWATQFFQSDLSQFNKGDQNAILNELDELVHSKLWDGKNWIADYKRLRVVAHQKP